MGRCWLGSVLEINQPLNKKRFTNLMKFDLTVTEDAVLTLKSCPDIKFPVVWTKHIKSPTLPVSLPSSISIFRATSTTCTSPTSTSPASTSPA